jgi:hypothetical protein
MNTEDKQTKSLVISGTICPKCDGYVPGHATGAGDICTCDPITVQGAAAGLDRIAQLERELSLRKKHYAEVEDKLLNGVAAAGKSVAELVRYACDKSSHHSISVEGRVTAVLAEMLMRAERAERENERLTRERDEAVTSARGEASTLTRVITERDEARQESVGWRSAALGWQERAEKLEEQIGRAHDQAHGASSMCCSLREQEKQRADAMAADNARLRGALEQAKTALLSGDACHALKEIRAALADSGPDPLAADSTTADPYERVFGLKPTDDAPVTIAASKPAPLPPMELIDELSRDAAGQKGGGA